MANPFDKKSMTETKKLQGKVAMVTASTKGIGLASAKLLADNGATVYLAARSQEKAQKIISSIEHDGGTAKYVYFSAQEPETYCKMVQTAIDAEGHIDILVNNYGSTDRTIDLDILSGDSKMFFSIITDNLQSVYYPVKAALPHMIKNGGGSIINISSIGSLSPDITATSYGVTKAAINFLTQDIATQYGIHNIRCNAILPGMTATDALLDNMTPEFINAFLKHIPLNRAGKPEDIANAVLFLASDDSSYITGQLLEVAGGYNVPTPMYADKLII